MSARVVVCDEAETLGVNSRSDLAAAEAAFQARARAQLLAEGVTLQAPDTVAPHGLLRAAFDLNLRSPNPYDPDVADVLAGETSVDPGRADLTPADLRTWAETRHRQIHDGDLLYLAHNLDLLARVQH